MTEREKYKIKAYAFGAMTGYMAPGKDASPLSSPASYEERIEKWDDWLTDYGPCVAAMLKAFDAIIYREWDDDNE